jgi:hypothetical protein
MPRWLTAFVISAYLPKTPTLSGAGRQNLGEVVLAATCPGLNAGGAPGARETVRRGLRSRNPGTLKKKSPIRLGRLRNCAALASAS